MKRGRKLIAVLFAFALVAAACGDDDSADTTAAATEAPTETQATEAPSETEAPTETAAPEPMEIATDFGVDLEAGTITVGLLSDFGPTFGALVTPIVDGHNVYWDAVNAAGGINGLEVVVDARDTNYDVQQHVTLFEEMRNSVVAFGHSTGSPHTVAIAAELEAQGILTLPLTWYSGWTDPAYNAALMHHGMPYCLESQTLLEWVAGEHEAETGEKPKVAIVTLPGDYGLDNAEGAKLGAAALGLEVVADLGGQVTGGDSVQPVVAQLAGLEEANGGPGLDIVYMAVVPALFEGIFGLALQSGVEARWTGAAPNWLPSMLDGAIAEPIARDWYGSSYVEPWSGDSAGLEQMKADIAEFNPSLVPNDYYAEGYIEASILHAALEAAYAAGDLTQNGVLAAAKALESVDFNGLAPAEVYQGSPNEQVQRQIYLVRPSLEDRAAGGAGMVVAEENFTADIVADFTFESACFKL